MGKHHLVVIYLALAAIASGITAAGPLLMLRAVHGSQIAAAVLPILHGAADGPRAARSEGGGSPPAASSQTTRHGAAD